MGSLLSCSEIQYSDHIKSASTEYKTLYRDLTSRNRTNLSSGDVEKVLEYGDSVLNETIEYFEQLELANAEKDPLVLFGDTVWNDIKSIQEINERPFTIFSGPDTLYTKIIDTIEQGSYLVVHLKGLREDGTGPHYGVSYGYNAFVVYQRSKGKLMYMGITPFLDMCFRYGPTAETQIQKHGDQIFLIAYCNQYGSDSWRQNVHVYELLPKPNLVHFKMMKSYHQTIYWESYIDSLPPPYWMSKLVGVDFIETPYGEMHADFWSSNNYRISDNGNSLIVDREIRHYSIGWDAYNQESVEDSLMDIRIVNEYEFNLKD